MFVQVGVITRHNRLASKPVMVLLEIHWTHDWTIHLKNCNGEWWGKENVTLNLKTNFYRCSNKSVLAQYDNGFCFGNLLDFFNVVIYPFPVHPSCQEIFLF